MEAKKGRMDRVYTAPGKKASPEKVKHGGSDRDPGRGKSTPKTPRMGG
jgi:hypothetical protein